MSSAAAVKRALEGFRFETTDEDCMQRGVEEALRSSGIDFYREFRLNVADRIDFFVDGGVGIECKVKGTATQAMRQLLRYARSPLVSSLCLVSSRPMLDQGMPNEVSGKPLLIVRAWRSAI